MTLIDTECEVCQPVDKAERVQSRQICMSTESRKCSSTDVEGRWVKMCRKIDARCQPTSFFADKNVKAEQFLIYYKFKTV